MDAVWAEIVVLETVAALAVALEVRAWLYLLAPAGRPQLSRSRSRAMTSRS